MITYLQALILGLFQGFSELFPVSSLGHSVLLAWLFNWHKILAAQSQSESFFLSFLVILHVATALALFVFYRKTWYRIIRGFWKSVKTRKVETADGRLAWLLIVASIPAGITGLALEHVLRVQFAKPLSAIIFLFINGCILIIGQRHIDGQRNKRRKDNAVAISSTVGNVGKHITVRKAIVIGFAQIGALIPGISRGGITMVSGMYSGLNQEDAARFSFLLATPLIFAAGLLKLPDLFGSLDAHVRGQILLGGIGAAISAYIAVKFLDKYFQKKGLKPFGIYCLGISVALLLLGIARGHF